MINEIIIKKIEKVKRNDTKTINDIKPQNGLSFSEAKEFAKNLFSHSEANKNELDGTSQKDNKNITNETKTSSPDMHTRLMEKLTNEYVDELKQLSEFPSTISETYFKTSDLELTSPEMVKSLREEFALKKNQLIKQWEIDNNRSWPTYKENVFITNVNGESVQIHKIGDKYDAHHIQPLCLGGKNEAGNITPLNAKVHFDHRGIHSTNGAYDQIIKELGGKEL